MVKYILLLIGVAAFVVYAYGIMASFNMGGDILYAWVDRLLISPGVI